MANYDITFLVPTLVPVVTGLPVDIYSVAYGQSIAQAVNSGVLAASGTTDANGHVNVNLATSTTFVFCVGSYSASLAVTPASAGSFFVPVYSTVGTTSVHGVLENADGTPQVGATVTANLNASGPVLATNLILAKTITTTTDMNGNWSMNLISNAAITEPKNTLYTFVFTLPPAAPAVVPFITYGQPLANHGISFSHVVFVPNVTSVDFATLV